MYWVLFSRIRERGGGVNTLTPLATVSLHIVRYLRINCCIGTGCTYVQAIYCTRTCTTNLTTEKRKRPSIHTGHDMLRPCMKRRRVCIQGHRTAIEVELSARARSVLSFLSLLSFRVSITDQCVEASFDKSSVERPRCSLFEGAFGLLCF